MTLAETTDLLGLEPARTSRLVGRIAERQGAFRVVALEKRGRVDGNIASLVEQALHVRLAQYRRGLDYVSADQ